MDIARRPVDDLLEVLRVLLLLQASILLATTVEALLWGIAFGAARSSVVMSAAAAVALFVARARFRPDRRWIRCIVYVVEGVIIVTHTIDGVLAILIARTSPPVVALLTGLLLPVAVIALMRRSRRATTPPEDAPVLAGGVS